MAIAMVLVKDALTGCLIDGTSVSACDHADAAPNQDFARLDTLTQT